MIAVHHATPALGAAAIPGPDALYVPLLRHVYRRAYKTVDAVMSVVDPLPDAGREASIRLQFGVAPEVRRAAFETSASGVKPATHDRDREVLRGVLRVLAEALEPAHR